MERKGTKTSHLRTWRWFLIPLGIFCIVSGFSLAEVAKLAIGPEPVPIEKFVNFESAHVHPLDKTPDGSTLMAVNTAANTLEVFDISGTGLVHKASIPVGLDPVSVRARNNTEAWVVNVISDNVSIVDLVQGVVIKTLQTANEPSDIVFAGNPKKGFVSCAERESIYIFDLADLDADPTEVLLIGEQPRAMAVSPDGNTVYTAFFESGNQTTVISGNDFIADGGLIAPPAGATIVPNDVKNVNGPYGGGVPVPNDGVGFNPPMNPALPPKEGTQSLVVKKNAQGKWMDDNGGDWTSIVSGGLGERMTGWDMKDRDVAVLDANTLSLSYQQSLGNILMALAVNPSTGKVAVVGTDALNHIRFTPNLKGIFLRVNLSQFSQGNASNAIIDLNGHLDYSTHSVSEAQRKKSIGDPRGIAWTSDGATAYITGMGSNNVIVIGANGDRTLPEPIEVGEGPTGIVLDESNDKAYVLNKFEGSISTISISTAQETARTPFFDPTPLAIKTGRKHLYNTHLGSGNGTISCASCHVDAKWDRLAWDLGDPSGSMETVGNIAFHPLKGLKTTQSLIDIINKADSLLHWRGDRETFADFAPAFEVLQGLDAPLDAQSMSEFEDFLAATFYPPNPYRETTINRPLNLNGLIRGPGTTFQSFLMDDLQGTDAIGTWHEACGGCHVNHTGRGASGSSFGAVQYFGNENMSADLRSFYKKLGFYYRSDESTAGFGAMSDGVVDMEFFKGGDSRDGYFFDFHALLLGFSGGGPTFSSLGFTATPHESQGAHFAVGRQATLSIDTGVLDEVNDLLALANNPQTLIGMQQVPALGFIVKGRFQGELRGFYYVGNNSYQSDSSGHMVSHNTLVTEAQNAGPLTWMLVPSQVAERLGVDRNDNGILDKEDKLTAKFTYSPTTAPSVPIAIAFDASTSYSPSGNVLDYAWDFGDGSSGNGLTVAHTYTSAGTYTVRLTLTDTESNEASQYEEVVTIAGGGLSLRLKMLLEGPYDTGSGLMNDLLRSSGVLGTTDPYGLGTSLGSGMLQLTGNDAPVDWVHLQLRDANDPSLVLSEIAALVQRDGDVMMPDGNTELLFNGIGPGMYVIFFRHMNHLPISSDGPQNLVNTSVFDLIDPNTPVYGPSGEPGKLQGGKRLLWAGDGNGDGAINAIDKNLHWRTENGQAYQYGIRTADWNLDGAINAADLNLCWRPNNSRIAELP